MYLQTPNCNNFVIGNKKENWRRLNRNKLGVFTAFRDLVWRKHEAENIFTRASWHSLNSVDVKLLSKYQSVISNFLINFYLAFFFFLFAFFWMTTLVQLGVYISAKAIYNEESATLKTVKKMFYKLHNFTQPWRIFIFHLLCFSACS